MEKLLFEAIIFTFISGFLSILLELLKEKIYYLSVSNKNQILIYT